MVATTFAADTPLAITEFVRGQGIWKNWFWWNLLMGSLLSVFLFSRLWRRAEVLTDNELLEIRYSGKPAAFLRAFKAGYFSILYNFIVMGWVINAMASVVSVMLNIDKWSAVWLCVVIALVYAILSGFWGVVITDLVQFCIAMFGSISLAIIALGHVGGMEQLLEKLSNLMGTGVIHENTLKFIPPVPEAELSSSTFWESPFSKFIIFISVMWWSHHGTDGGGYIIQRMSSAKNERHAMLATLWFNLAHYALRVWPWIIVAAVSIVMFPVIPPSYSELGVKAGYPLVMNTLLGPGLKGILIVSFLAAFMSTIDTHLNSGACYLINDVYKRFYKPDASEKHYVIIGKIITVVLMILAAFTALKMQSIEKAWEFIFSMGAGIGLVLILRWFWWRINALTEIVAMISSLVVAVFLNFFGPDIESWLKIILGTSVTTFSWVFTAYFSSPEDKYVLRNFVEKVNPGGPGWKQYSMGAKVEAWQVPNGVLMMLLGSLSVYAVLLSIGQFIYGNIYEGLFISILGIISILGLIKIWR